MADSFIIRSKDRRYLSSYENAKHSGSESYDWNNSFWKINLDKSAILFNDAEDAKDFIKKYPKIFENQEYEIIPAIVHYETKIIYEKIDNDVYQAKSELENQLLNVRNHKDSILVLLNDESLVHDMNACAGYIGRQLEKCGLQWTSKEAFEFSNLVSNRVYRDADGKLRSSRELNDRNLSMKARKVSSAFATLADALLLLEKYEDEIMTSRRNKNFA